MSGQLLDLFWRVVRGSGSQQAFIDQIVQLLSRNTAQAYQDLVTAIKKVIKSKPESPQAKLQALKVLISAMDHAGFRSCAAERVLTRLGILARKAKESPNAGIWGPVSGQSQEALAASREFGRVLGEAMRKWAEDYGNEPESPFRKAYEEVSREEGGREEQGLEEVRAQTLLLREAVLSSQANAQLSSSLQSQVNYLRSQLPSLAVRLDEIKLQEYLDALEAAESALEDSAKLPAGGPQFDFDFPPEKSEQKQGFDFDIHWGDQGKQTSQQFHIPEFDFEDAQFPSSPSDNLSSKLKSLEELKEQYLRTIENNEKSLEDQLIQIKSLRFTASDAGTRLQQVQLREKDMREEAEKLRFQLNLANKDKNKVEIAIKQREIAIEREIDARDREISELRGKVSELEDKIINFEPKYAQILHENEQFREQIESFNLEFLSKQQKSREEMVLKQRELEQAQKDISSLVAQVTSLKLALSRDTQSCGVQTVKTDLSVSQDFCVQITGEKGRKRYMEIEKVQGIAIRPRIIFPRLRLESVFRVSIQPDRPHKAEIEYVPGISILPELIDSQSESISIPISLHPEGTSSSAITTVEVGNPFEQDTATLMASLPAPKLRESPVVANEAWIKGLYASEQGVLYANETIEVRFRTKTDGNNCLIWLLITPKDTQIVTISAISGCEESNYSVQIVKQVLPSPLLSTDPAKILLSISALFPVTSPPKLDFISRSAAEISEIRLLLPVSFLRFMHPLESSDLQAVIQTWEELKSTAYEQSFEGLKADIRSMGLLRTALACEDRFKVLTSLQLPELQRTWLLVCGQVVTLPVLVLVALRRDASGGVVTAYASNAEIKQAIAEFVLSLVT